VSTQRWPKEKTVLTHLVAATSTTLAQQDVLAALLPLLLAIASLLAFLMLMATAVGVVVDVAHMDVMVGVAAVASTLRVLSSVRACSTCTLAARLMSCHTHLSMAALVVACVLLPLLASAMRPLHALAVPSLTTTTMMVTMLAAPLAMDLMLTVVSTALMVAVTPDVAVDVVAVEAGVACKPLLTSWSTSTKHASHSQVVELYFYR
jgi:hypothetical protein